MIIGHHQSNFPSSRHQLLRDFPFLRLLLELRKSQLHFDLRTFVRLRIDVKRSSQHGCSLSHAFDAQMIRRTVSYFPRPEACAIVEDPQTESRFLAIEDA